MADWEVASSALRQAEDELARDPQKSIRILEEWLPLLEAEKNHLLLCDALDLSGRCHLHSGRDLEAGQAFAAALQHAEIAGDRQRGCRVRKNTGVALVQMKAFHQALQCFLDVCETAAREGYSLLEGQAENNIAVIHNMNGNHEAARAIFLHLMDHVDEMGLSHAIAHYNLADVNLLLGDLDKVAVHIRTGKKAAVLEGRMSLMAGFSYFAGILMRRRVWNRSARKQLERAAVKCREVHEMVELVRCSYELACMCRETGEYEDMMAYCRDVIRFGKAHGMMDETVLAHEILITGLHAIGDGEAVWHACREYATFLTERESYDAERMRVRVEMEQELLEVGRSRRRLERELAVDPLTGLDSYRILPRKIQESRNAVSAPSILLFLDLDNLKTVNDTHGHMVGDRLIIGFAKEIKRAVPARGIATRKSGDEFVVFLPDMHLHDAIEYVEQFLRSLSEKRDIGGVMIPLSCSIGIAADPDDSTDPAVLVDLADMAMLQAKQAGRARYAIADRMGPGGAA